MNELPTTYVRHKKYIKNYFAKATKMMLVIVIYPQAISLLVINRFHL